MSDICEKVLAPQINAAVQSTSFDDLCLEERITRLRDAVRDLRRSIGYLSMLARRASDMAEHHEHGVGGQPMFTRYALQNSDSIQSSPMRDDLA